MLEPPSPADMTAFAADFGQRVLLTVDTEEEFDWTAPFTREGYGLTHVEKLVRFQAFCEEIGAHPVYLVDWPIANDPRAVEIIGDAVARGAADVGAQLHVWMTPPYEEEITDFNSYAGNLPADLETRKIDAIVAAITEKFGAAPKIYRAGRYGLSKTTAAALEKHGIAIDTSVRALFDYTAQHGPDYTHHPAKPYWTGCNRALLELPVTSVYWGVLRQLGRQLHRAQRHFPTFFALFSKLGLLERIPLTPEGVSLEEGLRGVDIALDEGLPLLVLSLHSPTLAPGHTPYARTDEEVERVYDWLRGIYAYLGQRGVKSASVDNILQAVSDKSTH